MSLFRKPALTALADGIMDDSDQIDSRHRFDQKAGNPFVDRSRGGVNRRLTGPEQHRKILVSPFQLAHEVQSVAVGQPDVGITDIDGDIAQDLAGRFNRGDAGHG